MESAIFVNFLALFLYAKNITAAPIKKHTKPKIIVDIFNPPTYQI
jgi:hypothetical protein